MTDLQWWRDAVFYQVYIRSFADGNDDGVGDLAEFDRLVADASAAGIRITIDLVPNHSSDQRAWFREALAAAPGSPARERYIFRDGRGADGAEPPNNWPSVFGGPAWTRVPDGQWYLHLFAPEQPDLDFTNPEVLADLETTMRFWLDRGVDGFRIDVAHGMAKAEGLPDMEQVEDTGLFDVRGPGDLRFDQDGVHALHRRVRAVLDEYPGAMAVGEVWVHDDERLARYLAADELHLAFNFQLVTAAWGFEGFRTAILDSLETVAGTPAPACWVLSNHDVKRHVTRFGGGELGLRRARAAALLQLALPGAVYLYNGDELGLPNVDDLPDEVLQDPVWERSGRTRRGRDGCRVPMPWSGEKPPFGFSATTPDTWLPMPEAWAPLAVAAQETDPGSMLTLYRIALALRSALPAFHGEELTWLTAPEGCLAFRRLGGLVCLLNLSGGPVPLPEGSVLLASVDLDDGVLPDDAAVWLQA
jgi:alpha-glucosidase